MFHSVPPIPPPIPSESAERRRARMMAEASLSGPDARFKQFSTLDQPKEDKKDFWAKNFDKKVNK